MEIVSLSGVSKDYRSGALVVHALHDVSLSIESGEFTALAGPSGSGKSTLLNLIGGLDHPTGGRVRVAGVETNGLAAAGMARLRLEKIGFVFQSYNLVPVLTAMENAEYVLMLRGVPAAERRARVARVLREVGLEGMERRFPRELSGGQQQRVAIARAIAAEPALVLADEPTANVDSHTAASLLDLMDRLNREKGVTFLFSTHDALVIARARRVIRLRDGTVVEESARSAEAT